MNTLETRDFKELILSEIGILFLIANRNAITNPLDLDMLMINWIDDETVQVSYQDTDHNNKLVMSVDQGGFYAYLLTPESDYMYNLLVPFHLFLDYLESINVRYRNY